MCISIVSCSSKKSEPDLGGAVLEGYESVPFKKLLKDSCENWKRAIKKEGEDATITYKITSGWDTDKFDESDYLSSKQSAVTCSFHVIASVDGVSMDSTQDYYLVHDSESNTLKVIGRRNCLTDGKDKSESFLEGSEAMDQFEDLLRYYNYSG